MITACPLCEAPNYTMIYKDLQSYSIVKCDQCHHIYTLGAYQAEELYKDEVYKVLETRHTVFDKILNWEYKKVIKKINSFKLPGRSLLDFGCGKGKFGDLAKKNGWRVKCVETSLERAAYAKEIYGLEVSTNPYFTGRIFNNDFYVITLFHVLEHLPYPKKLLEELIKHNLTKNGLVVIETPNFQSLQARIAGNKWMHLDVPRHINHFTSKCLDKIAGELGLTILKTTYFSFHLGVLGMIDSFLKLFGFRRNIISELKRKKNIVLILGISLLFPFAILLETFAAATGRGGITRKYFMSKR